VEFEIVVERHQRMRTNAQTPPAESARYSRSPSPVSEKNAMTVTATLAVEIPPARARLKAPLDLDSLGLARRDLLPEVQAVLALPADAVDLRSESSEVLQPPSPIRD